MRSILFVVALLQFSLAQTDYSALEAQCIDGVRLDKCKEMEAESTICSNIDPNDQASLVACVCTQSLFSLYVECREQLRLCSRSALGDAAIDDIISSWHTACDAKLSAPVTTPTFSTTVATANVDSCLDYLQTCSLWSYSGAQCSSSYTDFSAWSSCECQTRMIQLGSICEYDGNRTCKATGAEITNLWAYTYCEGAAEFLVAQTTGDTAGTTRTTSRASPSITSFSPSFFASQTGSSSSSSTSDANARRAFPWVTILVAVLGGIWTA